MISVRTVLLSLALLGCDARQGRVPDWVASAPTPALAAVSCRMGWALGKAHLDQLLARFPQAERALERFLERTRVSPGEAGRITVYLAPPDPAAPPSGGAAQAPDLVIQLGGFDDPGGLQGAIADAFPAAGIQVLDGRELPLYAVLDWDPYRFRAMADGEGRVWLGDRAALARLGGGGRVSRVVARSMAMISPDAAVQGFIRPAELLREATGSLPGELARSLPRGIESLSWGLTPGPGPRALNGFELSLGGSRGAIEEALPWLQRLAATVTAMPGAPVQAPEFLQEKRRLGLRCQLTQDQVDLVLARLNQPAITGQ